MSWKTKIKNDLWRINYVVPFAKKHLNEEVGAVAKAGNIVKVLAGKKAVRGASPRTVAGDILELFERVQIDVDPSSSFAYSLDERLTIAASGNFFSNFTIDAAPLVNGAFADALKRASSEDDEFGKEAAKIGKAIKILLCRMADAVLSSGMSDERKVFLSGCFLEMLDRPALSFREGLQRVLFLNQMLWQTRHRLNGLGRLDKLLGPLYEADVAAGKLDIDEAVALITEFLAILHEHYEFKSDALMGDIGQIIILGGLERDGSYFCNELTELIMKAQADLHIPDPKIFLRVSEAMPRHLLDCAVDALGSATGSPLFSNDDKVIPVLIEFGIDEQDAYDYCVSACWEPLVPGASIGQNNILVFDAGRTIHDVLVGPDCPPDYEGLVEACEWDLKTRFRDFLNNDLDAFEWARDPFVSLFYPSCIASREDISEGGAKYSNYGVTMVGMANLVDSLLNVRDLLGEGRTAADLRALMDASDSELQEGIELKHRFGSDIDPEAQVLTNRLTAALDAVADGYENAMGGKVKFGLSSPAYIMLGTNAPADLSGRGDGSPYTSHISNPSAAYTELVNFAAGLDYSGHRFNGNVVDFFVAPNLLADGTGKFADFLETAIRVGFYQMQMNVMDSATLVDAKAHPDRYPGLIVRVWGFSAYFNDLPDSYKDFLIERARQMEAAA